MKKLELSTEKEVLSLWSYLSSKLACRYILSFYVTAIKYQVSSGMYITRQILWISSLLTCSWHKKMKPQIHQFTNLKYCKKTTAQRHLKPLYYGVLFLIHYFEKCFKPCLFICSSLNSWIRGFLCLMSRGGYIINGITKGQFFSKGLIGILGFSQKTNERIRF